MSPDVDIDEVADDVEVRMDCAMEWLESRWYYHLLAGGAELALAIVGVWTAFAFAGAVMVGVLGLLAALAGGLSLLRRIVWVIVP